MLRNGYLSSNDIRELIIKIYWEPNTTVNRFSSAIYSCTKLTKLEIWKFTMVPPPSTFKGFLFLTTLVLEEVILSPYRLQSLVASCPLLERLTIINYHSSNSRITIAAPNLKYMYLHGEYTELSLYAPLLAKMYVELNRFLESEFADENQSLVCNYATFLGSCTNLVELSGRQCLMTYLSIGIKFCNSTLVFHQLKHIELSDVDFEDRSEMAAVARLIIGAPNLHKLKISAMIVVGYEPGAPDVSFVDFGFAPNFTLEKLRVVSLPYVCRYRSEMDDPKRCDLLSDLPLSIIHDILVRVPVRDAVRTSLLSRQWRYTWTSLPHLLFNFFGPSWFGLGHFMTEEFQDGADKSVNNGLALHKGPIHRFEMSYWCNNNLKSSWYKFEEWIHCLSNNEIRELIFKVFSEEDRGTNVLNSSSIYSCAKLTKLEIWFFVLPPPPSTFKGFLFLTSLVLGGVNLSPNTVESLIPYCPLLEKLRIMHSKSSEIRISSPNLKSMDLSGHYQKLCLSAPLLAKLHLDLKRGEFIRENLSSVCNYVNLLGSFTNLVELGGGGFFVKYLSTGFESCHPTLVFHHLKVMNLQMNFGDIKEASVVARLIIGAPNLHTL